VRAVVRAGPLDKAPSLFIEPQADRAPMIAYLGSIDLETTEATQDRERGIEFRLPALVRQMNAQFQSDWNMAEAPPA
jgi:hypothetical protein